MAYWPIDDDDDDEEEEEEEKDIKMTVTTDLAISLGMSTTSCSDGFKPSINKAWTVDIVHGYSFKHRFANLKEYWI